MNVFPRHKLERFGVLFCAPFTTILFFLVFYFLDRGLNFADEGMYLYSISHPTWPWALSSDFGNLFHPIFMALGEDLYAFRVFTYFVILIASKLCIISSLILLQRHINLNPWSWYSLGFALWACILGYYVCWLPTASYNTAALLGIFGSIASLNMYAFLSRPHRSISMLSNKKLINFLYILILICLVFFGFMAFIGKPTTGVGMGILAFFYMYFSKGTRSIRSFIYDTGFCTILVLFFLYWYFFVYTNGVMTIEKAFRYMEFYSHSHSLNNTLHMLAHFLFPTSYVLVLATWPLWALVLWAMHKEKHNIAIGITIIIMLVWLISSYIWIHNYIVALMLWPLAVTTFAGACIWRKSWKHVWLGVRLSCIFAISGFIYHAGSDTYFEFKLTEALVLPALAIVSLCVGMIPARQSKVLPSLALILCCGTVGTLFFPFLQPSRQGGTALWEMTEPIKLRPNSHPIFLSLPRKNFTQWLLDTSNKHGWKAGTPLINSSFYSSISLFLLDGYKIEGTWAMHSSYVPKEKYSLLFSYAPAEEVRKAWIIKPAIDSPRNMPTDVFKSLGLPFPEGYELLSTSPPESVDGIWPSGHYEIWKPQ